VFAAEHLLGFASLDVLLQLVQPLEEVGLHVLTLVEPVHQHRQVVGPLAEALDQRELFFEPPPSLQDLLGLGLVLPEIWLGRPGLESVEFFTGFRCLKDNSAGRRIV
jgi:hypothetical protein